MADPAAAENRKALNQSHKKRGDVCLDAKCENNSPIFFLLIMNKPGILYWLIS